jgi:ABC-type nickel/cobalt efflux system permease component RcnA
VPTFAAGTALWGTALLLVSIPPLFVLPVRIVGVVTAILFIITAVRIFMGEQLMPTSTPLPMDAYPLLVVTFIGWIWMLWHSEKAAGK